MRDVQASLDWMKHESQHRSHDWNHLCQSSVRSALGLPAWAASARKAYEMTPHAERHYTAAKDVPAGAICYGLLSTTYGHAWLSAGHGMGWTVDYKRRGQIDLAPVNLPNWTHDSKVHWSLWTPKGHIKPIAGHAGH